MKHGLFFIFLSLMLFISVSCSSSKKNDPVNDNETANDSDVMTDEFGFDLSSYKVQLEKFSANVKASRISGTKDTVFEAEVYVTGGTPEGAVTYEWKLPAEGILSIGTKTDKKVSFKFSKAGEYTVEVTVKDAAGTEIVTGGGFIVFDSSKPFTIGDLNDDGVVDQTDVDLLTAYVEKTGEMTDAQIKASDFNLDTRIDTLDVDILKTALDSGKAPVHVQRGVTASGDPIMDEASGDPIMLSASGDPIMIINPMLLNAGGNYSISFKEVNLLKAVSWDDACLKSIEGKPGVGKVLFDSVRPGYGTFVIPPEYMCLKAETGVEVTLSNGTDSVVVMKDLRIQPLPAASAKPGTKVLETMGRLRVALSAVQDGLDTYADNIEATDDEKAALKGMALAASEQYDEAYGSFYVNFNELDDAGKTAYERLAKAQGLDDANERLKAATEEVIYYTKLIKGESVYKAGFGTPSLGESMIKLVCAFNKIANIAAIVGDINENVSAVLDYLDWWPLNKAPVVGPAISFLSALSNIVGAVADIIKMVAEYVPTFGNIKVEVTNPKMGVGDSTKVHASIKVNVVSGLCKKAGGVLVDSLMDKLKNALTARMGKMIPVAGKMFQNAKYQVEKMGKIAAAVYKAVGWLAGKIIDATGLKEYMESLAEKFCKMFGDPYMAISGEFLKASCSSLKFAGGVGEWTCIKECAGDPSKTITYSGMKKVCDNEKQGVGKAECMLGTGTDDDSLPDSDDSEIPDSDTTVPLSQELFKTVTSGENTPGFTVTEKNLPAPPGNGVDQYFEITGTSLLESNSAPLKRPENVAATKFDGTTLYMAGYPGMNADFYLDWNYFKAVTAAEGPQALAVKGDNWTKYLLYKGFEVQLGTVGTTSAMEGSVFMNIVLPSDVKFIGDHEAYLSLMATTNTDSAGDYVLLKVRIVPQLEYTGCYVDNECDTATQLCDPDYHYCVDK
ncbi:MAG TPA: dockerin type I domain-containing protein [bacterium]|nr:dockerin type I domain-containing protein [bacterium]